MCCLLLDSYPNNSMSAYKSTFKISQILYCVRFVEFFNYVHWMNRLWVFEDNFAKFTLFFLIFDIGLSCAVFCKNKRYFRSHVLYDSPYDSDTCNVFEINVLNFQCFYVRECGFGIRRSLHCYIWQQQNVMKYINCHSTGSNLLRVYYLSWGKIYVYKDNIM